MRFVLRQPLGVQFCVLPASLPDPDNYITMTATIPTYDKSDPNKWTPNGQQSAKLAMVGMHVVGSANGHPELIWATFEHVGNAPNAAYSYINSSGSSTSVQQLTRYQSSFRPLCFCEDFLYARAILL